MGFRGYMLGLDWDNEATIMGYVGCTWEFLGDGYIWGFPKVRGTFWGSL